MATLSWLAILTGLSVWSPARGDEAGADVQATPTHKQVRVIKPLHNGQPVTLNTFCLDAEGNLLACVSEMHVVPQVVATDVVEAPPSVPAGWLQLYSPEGELLREVELSFCPTAVNRAPDGSFFVAGAGRVARVSADFQVTLTADSPHVGDRASMLEKATKAAQEQMAQFTEALTEQIKATAQRIGQLEQTPADQRTERDTAQLAALQSQKQEYEEQVKQFETQLAGAFSAETMLEQAMGITGLAVTDQDLFLCCRSVEGRGYEVWRTNHDIAEPKRILTDLLGCCGQFDIQAAGDRLVLAENTKFQVAVVDREGQRQLNFGQRDRQGTGGFGSCCNPMNVRCCGNGDIITAESSVGSIKRFNSEGEYLGFVGRAKIGGGCKHVAVGWDEQRDRYYLMNVDKSHVCVLVPLAEAPQLTADEQDAKTARAGLGQKLVGEWSLSGRRARPARGGEGGVIAAVLQFAFGAPAQESGESAAAKEEDEVTPVMSMHATYFHFHPDGKLTVQGNYLESGNNSWLAVRQEGQTLTISQLQDDIAYYDFRIEFKSDDEAVFTMMYGDQPMDTHTYKRIVDDPADAQRPNDAAPPASAASADAGGTR
jgi:hypothetical protein